MLLTHAASPTPSFSPFRHIERDVYFALSGRCLRRELLYFAQREKLYAIRIATTPEGLMARRCCVQCQQAYAGMKICRAIVIDIPLALRA